MWAIKHLFSNKLKNNQTVLDKTTNARLSTECDITSYTPTNHVNACICMIDIVNFSSWCSDKTPQEIFSTMTNYNGLISNLIDEYIDVDKVELVGDSIMIIGGFRRQFETHVNIQNIVNLAIDILTNLDKVVAIFQKDTSLRIGIHCGDIYSGFIENPRKFQLFGNSINIASRLESYSLPGTFSISKSTLDQLKSKDISTRIEDVIGKPKLCMLKGIGRIECVSGFLKKSQILIADDDYLTTQIFDRICVKLYQIDCLICDTVNETFRLMKQNRFKMCIIDVLFVNISVLGNLQEFRDWEKVHRNDVQKIFLTTTDIDCEIKKTYVNLVDGYIDKNEIHNYQVYPVLNI